jgi:hypothetical protein
MLALPSTFPGLYLRDLTYVDDGNQTITERGYVNFEKLHMVSKLLLELKEYQYAHFVFRPVEACQKFLRGGMIVVDDVDALYTLSITNEPVRG